MIKKFCFVSVLISCVSAPSVFAVGDATFLGGLAVSNYSSTPDPMADYSAGTSIGAGVLMGGDFALGIGTELGVFYMTRAMSGLTYGALELPAMLRLTAIPILLLEAGPYIGFPLNTTATSSTDFGLKTGLGIMVPVAPTAQLRLQGIYSLGFNDVGIASGDQYSRNLDVLAGLTIGL